MDEKKNPSNFYSKKFIYCCYDKQKDYHSRGERFGSTSDITMVERDIWIIRKMREICGLQIIKGGHKAADDRLKSWASNAGVKTSRMNKCKER